VLILGHFDTVWPIGQLARMPARHDDGRFYGPGAFDMKAGIVIALLAMRALADARIERKGVGDFRLRATGIAAHAGVDPGRGASAVHELAWQVSRLVDLADPATGVTVNIGTFHGGSRPNVIADAAEASIDVRVPTLAEADRIVSAIQGLVARDGRVRLEVSGGLDRPPMERSAGVVQLYHLARALAADMGRTLAEGATGGGSDGNFTAALGIPTLDGLGADGDGAHALHEHVLLDCLAYKAALLAGLLVHVK
jgi:glutamate carboxypeptidase